MNDARRDAVRQAEVAARTSYGKLLSILAARSGDIVAAEDALADAFATALAQWPEHGAPDRPSAWLLTVARRSLGHANSRTASASRATDVLGMLHDERAHGEPDLFGDERLKLLFVCAHPAIAADVQAPLMLQTVLGLDARRIAACFLVSPAAIGQKLFRAKIKIRDAGIAFTVPEPEAIAPRTEAVLSAIYAAYGTAWEDVAGADPKRRGLSQEAIWLGRLLCNLMPDDPEAKGLVALMLHCEARRPARRDANGGFVALRDQDVTAWSRPMIVEAEAMLRAAAAYRTPGRFQTEAAIQSLHAHQRMTGERFTSALVKLYDVLVALVPTIGAQVARAVAYAEDGDVASARAMLERIDAAAGYKPWWAARARILWLAGDADGARLAAERAAGLSSDPAVRAFLLRGGYAFDR